MSDGASKADVDVSPTGSSGVRRAGRTRFCKRCQFTTTDVREFSQHQQTAHVQENNEENNKSVTRRNSLRRKSSAADKTAVVTEEPVVAEVPTKMDTQTKTEQVNNKNKEEIAEDTPCNDIESEMDSESQAEQMITKLKVEQSSKGEEEMDTEIPEKMSNERISDELLSSLALAPRKHNSTDSEQSIHNGRPSTEKVKIERMNGYSEEVLLVNHDSEHDDEPRLVIADMSENGDYVDSMDLSNSDGLTSISRSGNIQNRTYPCGNCDFTTTNAKSFLHHQKDVHNSDIAIYACDICDYATKYKQKLPRHRKLHFYGKDGMLESDLDGSLSERELRELREGALAYEHGYDDMDDEGEMEEEEEEEMVTLSSTPDHLLALPGATPVEKKKRIRQEVDPLKYYEVVDEVGVKYACSKCGNVYKWRKSLNKHWKEKHFGETPDLTKPPATLQNYTLYSRYKAKYGGQPPPPAAPNVVYGAAAASPANQLKNRSTPTSKGEDDMPTPTGLGQVVMPRQIGPFIGGNTANAALFNNAVVSMANHLNQQARRPESHHDVRKMMDSNREQARFLEKASMILKKQQQQQLSNQMEPLDFSKKSDVSSIKSEPAWADTASESDSLPEIQLSMMMNQANNQIAAAMKQEMNSEIDLAILKCTKCNFTAKSLVDYSSHMSQHLNKRAFKCAECQAPFTGIDELNKHFLDTHSEKIQEHKEAIQKIPHGLQQTYHLLKMPLDSIPSLSTPEIHSNEPRQLKCSMCNFIAKWPAELQKHAVSHSEERPFICMVCGSTYKWKWDLVKHFEKSHSSLPNPYKRRDGGGVFASTSSPSTPPLDTIPKTSAVMDMSSMAASYNVMMDEEMPPLKKRRLSENETPDTDDFFRAMLERQVRDRREMGAMGTPPHLKQLQLHSHVRAAFSDPVMKSINREIHMKEEEFQTPKRSEAMRHVKEALNQRLNSGRVLEEESPSKEGNKNGKGNDVVLPYKCTVCEYRARWPSEISQHMKNHSSEKPFHCPRCSYKSKWKWDVVKHLRRCGGGTVHDVIDTTKIKKMAPPNVMVLPAGNGQSGAQHAQQHAAQQHAAQSIQQMKKVALASQPVFPGAQLASSFSSSMPALSKKSLDSKFSVALGGQDHPEAMDMAAANKNTVFRSLVNQGVHYCLECPFVGSSPTELRRHSMLHSETKPFSCNTCGYSTRWKCDLKKHMKTYGHFNNNINLDSGDENEQGNEQPSYTETDDSDDDNKTTLYMCPQCPYNSYKKNAFDSHLRIHGSMMEEPSKMSPTQEEMKFKCSKCDFRSNDLSSFLHHKRSHNFTADETRNGESEPAPETIHLKQRRKPVKQFKCERCPYICFKKSSLDVHDAMHIPRGSHTFLCMFCDYNVFSMNLLLQHMRLHPEYNPAECSEADGKVTATELMEMEQLEEREINSEETKSMSAFEENNNVDDFQSNDSVLDFSKGGFAGDSSRSSPASVSKESKTPSPTNNNNKMVNNNNDMNNPSLTCEWCTATFPNVVALYQHSQLSHPQQLKAQEAGYVAASNAPSKGSQLEQIVRDRQREYQVYHQFMARQQPQIQLQIQNQLQAQANTTTQSLLSKYVPLAPKTSPQVSSTQPRQQPVTAMLDLTIPSGQSDSMEDLSPGQLALLKARKSVSQQKKARSFQCTKCTFTAPNAVTYLRHIERHGSNCKHTCLFCDYSIDRLNLLYQHMKGTHGTKWQGTTDDKVSVSVHSEDSNNNIIEGIVDTADEFGSADVNESMDDDSEMEDEGGALMEYNTRGIDPVILMEEDTVWRGVPLHTCMVDGVKHFKCTKCMFIHANPSTTALHSNQHGQNHKYKCNQCDYSLDSFKGMQSHIEFIHSQQEPVSSSKMSKSSVLIDDFPTKKLEVSDVKKSASGTAEHSCTKCPYKTTEKVKLQIHLERHNHCGSYECQLCDYSVDTYGHLRHHVKLHSTKPLPAQPGEETAASYEDQEFAKRWTANNLPEKTRQQQPDRFCFKCGTCPFFTHKKSQILNHRLNHINNGPHSCRVCSFSTKLPMELEEHAHFHSGLQPLGGQYLEFIVDPYTEMYKVIEKFPDDAEDEADKHKMDVDEETMEVEDDIEAMMMEEELRDTISGNDNLDMDKTAAETDIQFRNYKCSDCPYSSNSNAEYTKHLRLHGADKKFKCDYCTYSLERVNLVSQHRKLHFQESDFESAPLMSKLLNKNHEEYEAMLVKVGNEVAFPPVESAAKTHEDPVEVYIKSGEEKSRYLCTKCPYKCQALKNFKCHKQMHGINRKYRCDFCDWSAERLNLLIQHRRVHAAEKGFDPAPGEITFLNREYVLDSENMTEGTVGVALMEHQDSPISANDLAKSPRKNALGERIYYCKLCPFKSELINTYSYHKKLHCIQAKYSCSECSYSINNITSLKEHINLHQKERELIRASFTEGGVKHKCPKCPYTSTNKNMLVNHMSMHGAGRKHECNACDFSSDTQGLLQLHQKVHDDGYSESDALLEMELLLKRCPDVIGPQLYLSTSSMHEVDSDCSDGNDPDHKCDKCPFSTPSKDELGSHSEHHDARNKTVCMYCTYSCLKEEELITHIQVHFPSTPVDKEMLKILRRQSHKRNITKDFTDQEDKTAPTSTDQSQPDSTTVSEPTKDTNMTDDQQTTISLSPEVEKTKVYVCQFCEREFNEKAKMLLHEKQHLVGSKY